MTTVEDAVRVAARIGYPVLVRPSYVLGGRAMEIVNSDDELRRYVSAAAQFSSSHPILVDKYLEGKEVEADAICDGHDVLIPGLMEHIERAGVHSGDSMAVYPGIDLSDREVRAIVDYTVRIGRALGVEGLMNVQYVIHQGEVYVLEVNPRASRTVPFLSKITGIPMIEVATKVMLGTRLIDQGYRSGLGKRQDLVAIKAPVFSMAKLVGVDTSLGPEMKSTGEVMGVDRHFVPAMTKCLMAAGLMLPANGSVLLSVADRDKAEVAPYIRRLAKIGYGLYATEGTAAMIRSMGLSVEMVTKKLREGHPNVVDVIEQGLVQGVLNTVTGGRTTLQDGIAIRRSAAERGLPCFTSIDTFNAAVESLVAPPSRYEVLPVIEYLTTDQVETGVTASSGTA